MARTTHHSICSLCEASCGILVDIDEGRVRGIRGDPDDALSGGHVCPKVMGLVDIQEDPDRLRHPVRRTASGWEQVSWERALDDVAERIHALQEAHGRSAMASFLGNPNVHNLGNMVLGPAALRGLRTRSRFSATSVDQLPQMLASYRMFGHQLLLPVPDLDRTQLLVVLGANPMVSNGSLMTAPDIRGRLRALRQRSGRLVVVDPRRTETAAKADEHLFIRPGTDALWLLALLHVILAEREADLGHLGARTRGLDDLAGLAARFPPERVAATTGIDAETTRRLALQLADTERAVLYGRLGTCVQEHGGLAAWLVNAVNAVAGNLDRVGGAMFPQPAADPTRVPFGLGPGRGSSGRFATSVRELDEFGGELPVSALAEEIEVGAIRGLLVVAGNPVLSTPNGTRLDRALASLELCVSVDLTINETSRHAHWILPVAPPLSRPHYDLIFHLLAVRNTARFAPPVLPLEPGLRHDWQVLLDLKRRLARHRHVGLKERAIDRVLRTAGPLPILDLLLRMGRHGGLGGLSLRKLRAQPHGVDLGPLRPCLLERMPDAQPVIELAPPDHLADAARLDVLVQAEPAPLVLIGRRHLRSNNSWMHNSQRLIKGPPRCTLLVHPDDAARRDLEDGALVEIRSRVGAVVAPVQVTAEVMPGVVSLPHGWGHDRDGVQLRIAGARPGVSVNDLTDDQRIDPLSGNAVLNGVPVDLHPVTLDR